MWLEEPALDADQEVNDILSQGGKSTQGWLDYLIMDRNYAGGVHILARMPNK